MTAVEWLITEIDAQFTHINIRWKEEMIDKAKQMEKEQICDAFDKGKWDTMAFKGTLKEQYFNETFGKQ